MIFISFQRARLVPKKKSRALRIFPRAGKYVLRRKGRGLAKKTALFGEKLLPSLGKEAVGIKKRFDHSNAARTMLQQISSARNAIMQMGSEKPKAGSDAIKRWQSFYGKARKKLKELVSIYWDGLINFAIIQAEEESAGKIIAELKKQKEAELRGL